MSTVYFILSIIIWFYSFVNWFFKWTKCADLILHNLQNWKLKLPYLIYCTTASKLCKLVVNQNQWHNKCILLDRSKFELKKKYDCSCKLSIFKVIYCKWFVNIYINHPNKYFFNRQIQICRLQQQIVHFHFGKYNMSNFIVNIYIQNLTRTSYEGIFVLRLIIT